MLLTKMHCDACGRRPTLSEWFKGELTSEGYPDWRHPGVAFRAAGLAMTPEGQQRLPQYYERVFGHPYPEDASFLCPECQDAILEFVPEMLRMDEDPSQPQPGPSTLPAWGPAKAPDKPRYQLGEE